MRRPPTQITVVTAKAPFSEIRMAGPGGDPAYRGDCRYHNGCSKVRYNDRIYVLIRTECGRGLGKQTMSIPLAPTLSRPSGTCAVNT